MFGRPREFKGKTGGTWQSWDEAWAKEFESTIRDNTCGKDKMIAEVLYPILMALGAYILMGKV